MVLSCISRLKETNCLYRKEIYEEKTSSLSNKKAEKTSSFFSEVSDISPHVDCVSHEASSFAMKVLISSLEMLYFAYRHIVSPNQRDFFGFRRYIFDSHTQTSRLNISAISILLEQPTQTFWPTLTTTWGNGINLLWLNSPIFARHKSTPLMSVCSSHCSPQEFLKRSLELRVSAQPLLSPRVERTD